MKNLTLIIGLFFCLYMAQAQTNIMTKYNANFESGLTKWRFFEVPISIGSTVQVTPDAISGTKAAKVTYVADTNNNVSDRGFDNWGTLPPIIGGQTYNLRTFLKCDQTSGLTAAITFGFFNSTNAVVGQSNSTIPLKNIYTEYMLQTVAPATATSCWVAFRMNDAAGNKSAGTMYIDSVQIYPVLIDRGFDDNPARPSVMPGLSYTYSAFLKSNMSAGLRANMIFAFFDGTGNFIGQENNIVNLTNTYAQYSISALAPSNAANGRIDFKLIDDNGAPAGGSLYVDNVQMLQTGIPKSSSFTNMSLVESNTEKFRIYPNPVVNGMLNIAGSEIKSISIHSVSGQKLKDITNQLTNINVSNLHSGIYFVKILTETGESTQKLILK